MTVLEEAKVHQGL